MDRILHFLLKGGPIAQHEAKQLVLRARPDAGAAAQIDRDNAALIARLRVSAEGQEGLSAFLDKRQAAWSLHRK